MADVSAKEYRRLTKAIADAEAKAANAALFGTADEVHRQKVIIADAKTRLTEYEPLALLARLEAFSATAVGIKDADH